jgi:hypothetical protein
LARKMLFVPHAFTAEASVEPENRIAEARLSEPGRWSSRAPVPAAVVR